MSDDYSEYVRKFKKTACEGSQDERMEKAIKAYCIDHPECSDARNEEGTLIDKRLIGLARHIAWADGYLSMGGDGCIVFD